MVRSGETNEKFGGDNDDWIGNGGEDSGGRRAEEDCGEGLEDGEARSGAGFDENEPDGVANHEDEVDWEEGGAGGVGEEDEADANDEVDEARAEIEQPIAVVDGKDAPFRDDDEDKADDVAAGNDGGADGDDSKQEVQDDVHKRADCIATFANENIIGHIVYYNKNCEVVGRLM